MSEYSEKIKISEKMANTIDCVMNYPFVFLHGSVQCGKSVTAALSLALLIENSSPEDNLFMTIGYTESSAINNFWHVSGFGLEAYFGPLAKRGKYPGTNINCLKIRTKNGMKYVLAFGGNTKTSGNAFHGFSFKGGIGIDELDRLTPEVIDEIKQRIVAAEHPHVVATMNPNVPTHWVYKFMDNYIKRGVGIRIDWKLDDNVGLSPERIQAVKDMYDPNSVYYRRYINGESVNPEGCVYNLYEYNYIADFSPNEYTEYITVADPGVNSSATAFIMMGLKFNRETFRYEVHVLRDYHHKNKDYTRLGIKLPEDYANDYCDFILECAHLMNDRMPRVIYIDEDITFYRVLRLACISHEIDYGLIKYVIKDDIETRIKNSINLLYSGKLKFYTGCKNTIQNFTDCIYDEKKAVQGKYVYLDEPQNGTDIDCVDATCYGMNHYLNKLFTS